MPLTTQPQPILPWVTQLGLRIQNPVVPFRVLGYDLVLSPDGVQEDWGALYQRLEQVSRDILTRQVSLQGRSLLVSSKLFGRL